MNNRKIEIIGDLDARVNEYLIYLTHVQQSVTLPVAVKIEALNAAVAVANDINAVTAKVLAMNENSFNSGDIETFVDRHFSAISKKIDDEIRAYDKKLNIDEKILFSLREAIETLTGRHEIRLSHDQLQRMLSYKKLTVDREERAEEERIKRELEKLAKKRDKDLDALKLKTFTEAVRGTNHKNPEYFYKANNHVAENHLGEFRMVKTVGENDEGAFFIAEREKDIHVRVRTRSVLIDYAIASASVENNATLSILGFILKDESRVDFFIEETFGKSYLNSYLNAFNLSPIIRKCNECYLSFYSDETDPTDPERKSKKDIDDFFDGTIE